MTITPGTAGLRTRILLFLFTVYCSLFTAYSSQPPFRGQYQITAIDGDSANGFRLTGVFDDSSLLGYGAADATNNDLLFCASSFGDLDIYRVTNIVAVTGINLICDVVYNEPGAPRSGAPESGYAILARPITNGVVPRLSGVSYQKYSTDLMNDAINLSLYYAYLSAYTNGGAGTISSVSIAGGDSFGSTTNAGHISLVAPTNAIASDLSAWSGYAATQMIEWVKTDPVNDTNMIILSVVQSLSPTNIMADPVYYRAGSGDFTNSLAGQYITITMSNRWVVCDAAHSSYWENSFSDPSGPTGVYAYTDWHSGSTGGMAAAYGTLTNITATLRAGYNATDDCWQVSRDGVPLYKGYAESNVFQKPIAGYATGTPLYVELDPTSAGVSNLALAAYAQASNAQTYAEGIGVVASNVVGGDLSSLSNNLLSAWGTASNAQTYAEGVGAGATNFALEIGAGASNLALAAYALASNSVSTVCGVKNIDDALYNILPSDNQKTLVTKKNEATVLILPNATNSPFGFSISVVKGTNYPCYVVNTNFGGKIMDGTNVFNASTNIFFNIGLKSIETNTWIIDKLIGDWSII